MLVLDVTTIIAQSSNGLGQFRIISNNYTRVTQRTKRFTWEKAKTCGNSPATSLTAFKASTMSLRSIFD
ncbi:hypothetical protein RU08_07070 [Pseudomonas fulva]|uniref:Uncharacterized protein n=1 Tax=Pseudomonas fulva TaxID=47880 RepID=A0A0D0KVZ4_9PSED|nr:hypothetical protein RU08_07070 [Pseudomonas fulva]